MSRFAMVAFTLMTLGITGMATLGKETMTKIVTHDDSPDLKSDSFHSKPKTLYRIGNKYARMEEAEDTQNGLKLLIIVSEPDIWQINLQDKSGRHIVDPGPSYNFYAPIVYSEGAPKELSNLELGEEIKFMKTHEAKKSSGHEIKGIKCDRYEVTLEGYGIHLFTKENAEIPQKVVVSHGGKVLISLFYDEYEVGLEPKMDLFVVPKEVTISGFDNQESFGMFTTFYYQTPQPERISDAIIFMQKENLPEDDNQRGPALGFFAEVFSSNKGKIPEWKAKVQDTTGTTREVLDAALEYSTDMSLLLKSDANNDNVGFNDTLWGCYFASGKVMYLEALVQRLVFLSERESLNRYLVAGTAQWSLSSNASLHPQIKNYLEAQLKTAKPEIRSAIKDALEENSEKFRENFIRTIKEQRENGGWK